MNRGQIEEYNFFSEEELREDKDYQSLKLPEHPYITQLILYDYHKQHHPYQSLVKTSIQQSLHESFRGLIETIFTYIFNIEIKKISPGEIVLHYKDNQKIIIDPRVSIAKEYFPLFQQLKNEYEREEIVKPTRKYHFLYPQDESKTDTGFYESKMDINIWNYLNLKAFNQVCEEIVRYDALNLMGITFNEKIFCNPEDKTAHTLDQLLHSHSSFPATAGFKEGFQQYFLKFIGFYPSLKAYHDNKTKIKLFMDSRDHTSFLHLNSSTALSKYISALAQKDKVDPKHCLISIDPKDDILDLDLTCFEYQDESIDSPGFFDDRATNALIHLDIPLYSDIKYIILDYLPFNRIRSLRTQILKNIKFLFDPISSKDPLPINRVNWTIISEALTAIEQNLKTFTSSTYRIEFHALAVIIQIMTTIAFYEEGYEKRNEHYGPTLTLPNYLEKLTVDCVSAEERQKISQFYKNLPLFIGPSDCSAPRLSELIPSQIYCVQLSREIEDKSLANEDIVSMIPKGDNYFLQINGGDLIALLDRINYKLIMLNRLLKPLEHGRIEKPDFKFIFFSNPPKTELKPAPPQTHLDSSTIAMGL